MEKSNEHQISKLSDSAREALIYAYKLTNRIDIWGSDFENHLYDYLINISGTIISLRNRLEEAEEKLNKICELAKS